jgi:hypothetical protein
MPGSASSPIRTGQGGRRRTSRPRTITRFASDVDPHWAGIGASAEAIEALTGDSGLDVVGADPAEPPPAYR